MGRYSPLFRVAVHHDYFSPDPCTALSLVPTPRSVSLLERSGLVMAQGAGSVNVHYDHEQLDAMRLLARDADEPFALVFRVVSRDPAFANYTEPGTFRDDAILHFDSGDAVPEGAEGGVHRLHAGPFVSEADFVPLAPEPPEGVTRIKDRLIDPIAIVRVDLSGEAGGLLDEATEPTYRRYLLRFEARSTYWKYYLFGDMAERPTYVSDPDGATEFVATGETSLPDGRTAVTFRSSNRIPLRRTSEHRFQLRERTNGNGNGRVLIRRLPVASARGLYREPVDGQDAIVSDIYVSR